jgi:hypothetical protein
MWILIQKQHFKSLQMQILIQGFDDKNLSKFTVKIKIHIFKIKNCNILASMKDVKATGEASSPNSSSSKYEISLFFLF